MCVSLEIKLENLEVTGLLSLTIKKISLMPINKQTIEK